MAPKTIKASEFKAKCLELMEKVKQTGEEIVITKNGEPVSKLVPVRHKPKTLFGAPRQCAGWVSRASANRRMIHRI